MRSESQVGEAKSSEPQSPTPWYKQFWPWFIIALPATVVVAGLTTVFIAFKYADSLVNDNYYKDGLGINQTLAQDQRAGELNLRADIRFDTLTGEVLVRLSGDDSPRELDLLMLHPVDESADRVIQLLAAGQGRYRADLESAPRHRYYLRLVPRSGDSWRLNGELDFSRASEVVLTPDA